MRNNIKISVLVLIAVICYLAKSDTVSSGSYGLFFAETYGSPYYKFGPKSSIITYTLAEDEVLPHRISYDVIKVRFRTTKPDAVLVRIVGKFSDDYVEMYIKNGNVFLDVRIGPNNYILKDTSRILNNNVSHVIIFIEGFYSTSLETDDNTIVSPNIRDFWRIFERPSQIQIGGRLNKRGIIEMPFTGIMTEVKVADLKLSDLATQKNEHISVQGDVQLISGGPRPPQRTRQAEALTLPHTNDNLVFSGLGSGSGCPEDDEDECSSSLVTDSDDLITPTYVLTTTSPSSLKPTNQYNRTELEPCDDEDCLVDSGSGDGSGHHETIETTASTAIEVSEETMVTRKWSNIDQSSFTSSPDTTIESSLTTATVIRITTPENMTTELTEQFYTTTEIKVTEEFSSVSPIEPYPSTELPEGSSSFITPKLIGLVSGVSATIVIAIVIIIIIVSKRKSKKNEKATV